MLRPLAVAAIAAAVLAALIALFFPPLRQSVGLVSLGLTLAWVRHRYFQVPGLGALSGVPFRAFRGGRRAAAARKAKAA